MGKYLIYRINKGLCVIVIKGLNRLGIVMVRENVHDQGDAFVGSEGAINQAFPRWNVVAMLGAGQADAHLVPVVEAYKPHDIISACGRR